MGVRTGKHDCPTAAVIIKRRGASSVVKYLELMRNRQDVVKNAMNRLASKLIMEDFIEEEGSENMMVFSERIREIRSNFSIAGMVSA